MEKLTAEAMEDGAFGVYSALMYVPDRFNRTEELIALARVAARYDGAYQTHQRSEGDALFESLDEVFRIAREADIRANVTHMKAAYIQNWGEMAEVVKRINAARREGLDIAADLYPYVWGKASLVDLLPPWARTGTGEEIKGALAILRFVSASRRRSKRPRASGKTSTWEWEEPRGSRSST